jgi:hypothetical protein
VPKFTVQKAIDQFEKPQQQISPVQPQRQTRSRLRIDHADLPASPDAKSHGTTQQQSRFDFKQTADQRLNDSLSPFININTSPVTEEPLKGPSSTTAGPPLSPLAAAVPESLPTKAKREPTKKKGGEVILLARPNTASTVTGTGPSTNPNQSAGVSNIEAANSLQSQQGHTGLQAAASGNQQAGTGKEVQNGQGQGSSTGKAAQFNLRNAANKINHTSLQDLRVGETKKFFIFPSPDVNNRLSAALPEGFPSDLVTEVVSTTTNAIIPGIEIEGILERQRTKYTVSLVVRIADENKQYDMSLYGPAKLKLICCNIVVLEQALKLKPAMKCLAFPFYVFHHATTGRAITDKEITISVNVVSSITATSSSIFERDYTFQASTTSPAWLFPTDLPNGIVQMGFKASSGYRNLKANFINYLNEVNCGTSVESVTALPATLELSQASWKVLLSPADLAEGEWRVVLRWNAEPRDLDLHCKMNQKPYDVYFGAKNAGGRQNLAKGKIELDVDVTSGNGPETITFTPLPGANYRFFVHNYTGSRNRQSHVPICQSGATLTVYMGSGDVKSYNVSEDLIVDSSGNHAIYWNIFEIIDGEMHEVNQVVFDDLQHQNLS